MTAGYELVGQPGPLPGMGLTTDQVAGLTPVAAAAPAPIPAVAPAPAPAHRTAKKPEVISADPDGRQATVKDVLGRVLVIKPLTVVMRMRVLAFLGKELSANEGYMNFAVLGCAVQSIDGQDVPMIADRNSLERTINQIGDDGIAAAAVGLMALRPKDDESDIEGEAKN